MLIAIHRRDPAQLRDAVLKVATVRKTAGRAWPRAGPGTVHIRHFGPGITPTAAVLTELLQIFLAPGIAMPPTTSLLFRTLAILEGTLRTLCPGYLSSHPPRTSPRNWYAGEGEQRVASVGNHVTGQVMLLVCWPKGLRGYGDPSGEPLRTCSMKDNS